MEGASAGSMRRVAAILVIVAGGAALWWLGGSGGDRRAGKEVLAATSAAALARVEANDPRLARSHRFEDGGWIYVHLEGDPATIGFQHGYLLGPEIEDAFKAVSAGMMHETERDWEFFRKAGREMLWPKVDDEYKQELQRSKCLPD